MLFQDGQGVNFQDRVPSRRAHQKRKDSEDQACLVEEMKKDGEERATGGLRGVMVLLQSCCQHSQTLTTIQRALVANPVLMRVANQGIAPPPSMIAPRGMAAYGRWCGTLIYLLIFSGRATFRLLRLARNRAISYAREYDTR